MNISTLIDSWISRGIITEKQAKTMLSDIALHESDARSGRFTLIVSVL